MARSKSKSVLAGKSVSELVDFFDKNDMGDYAEQMPEVEFEVDVKQKRHFVAIDEALIEKVTKIASKQQVSVEELVNGWLKEKLLSVD